MFGFCSCHFSVFFQIFCGLRGLDSKVSIPASEKQPVFLSVATTGFHYTSLLHETNLFSARVNNFQRDYFREGLPHPRSLWHVWLQIEKLHKNSQLSGECVFHFCQVVLLHVNQLCCYLLSLDKSGMVMLETKNAISMLMKLIQ